MAIKKSFGGSLIRKPGAYSISRVDQSGGAPLGDNGTLFLVGEAETGAPGATEGYKRFTSAQFSDLLNEYSSGPIVDMAKVALTPSIEQGIGGADEIIVWKTNNSTKSSLDLQKSSTTIITLKDRNFGKPGNKISATVNSGSTAQQRQITVERGDTVENLPENDAQAQLEVQFTGSATSVTLQISGATKDQKKLQTTVDGSPDLDIDLVDFTMKELVDQINTNANYTATLKNNQTGTVLGATDLDPISGLDILASAKELFRLQEELTEIVNEQSALVLAELTQNVEGIPDTLSKTFLTGGTRGTSANSDFSDGFSKSLNLDWNVAVPGISRDATDDISDGLTDSGSTYDIASVLTALDSHLRLRGNIKNKKEAQGMAGFRDSSKSNVYSQAQTLNSELIQLFMQDVLVLDATGTNTWKFPHVFASQAAGIRLGTEVGVPLTHKFIAARGIGHVVDPNTGLESGDFDPQTDFDPAIDAGVTFAEQAGGGNRIVVDNTTYGRDQSFVFNRGSVVEAAQFAAKSLRETAELLFVGTRTSNGLAQSIKSTLRSKLQELNTEGVITGSDDAPRGFVEDSFTVTLQGNTATVQVEIKPAQGLDFVFIEFTLGDITQTA